jgi:hypothetical protein
MFTMTGAFFFTVGLILVFNPLRLAEKHIEFAWKTGTPRPNASARFLARRVGTVFLPVGCGLLTAAGLLALGVSQNTLSGFLPVAIPLVFALVRFALISIWRTSSRGNDPN